MNKRLNPLKENHLFGKAYSRGACAVSSMCAVYAMKNYRRDENGGVLPTKLGIAVNAKLGKATKRNRVKRIIREAYGNLLPKIAPGNIIVISARAAAFSDNVKTAHIQKSLNICLEKLGAYSGMTLAKRDPNMSSGKNKKAGAGSIQKRKK